MPRTIKFRKRREPKYKNKNKNKKSTKRRTYKKIEKGPNTGFKKMNCAPTVKGKTVNDLSCFTPDVLIKIKEHYNQSHPTNQIVSKDPREIWDHLKSNLSCEKENCWLKEIKDPVIRKNIEKIVFAPEHPAEWKTNPDEWLSNYDIFNVIRQYQDTHKDFLFMGPTTIDFDTQLAERGGQCVENQICNFELEQYLAKGKTKFGIVFNLDKHTQGGSHWVSLFFDTLEKIMIFFDSAGAGVPPEVKILMDRIIEQSKHLKSGPIHFDVYNNSRIRHQNGNTECGMYSLFFIITFLTRETPLHEKKLSTKDCLELFLKGRIPDEVVFDYRDLYFNVPE